jgi:hypothetical protein
MALPYSLLRELMIEDILNLKQRRERRIWKPKSATKNQTPNPTETSRTTAKELQQEFYT